MAVEDQQRAHGVQAGELIHVCRSAWLSPPAYAFYQAILLSFVEQGHAPTAHDLATLAVKHEVALEETLRTFERQDLIQRASDNGEIAAAYPYSAVPTIHRVRLDHYTETQPTFDLYAMCAIDALGIPLMLGHQPGSTLRTQSQVTVSEYV